jgi:hypothetical protein
MTRKRFSEEDGLGTEILFVEDFGLESQPAKAILITHLCYARHCEKREMKGRYPYQCFDG